jgi:hypothetical protein
MARTIATRKWIRVFPSVFMDQAGGSREQLRAAGTMGPNAQGTHWCDREECRPPVSNSARQRRRIPVPRIPPILPTDIIQSGLCPASGIRAQDVNLRLFGDMAAVWPNNRYEGASGFRLGQSPGGAVSPGLTQSAGRCSLGPSPRHYLPKEQLPVGRSR